MLHTPTDPAWLEHALANFDRVLIDHAHCESKAAAAAMSLVAAFPDRDELVRKLTALAIEELRHFRAVHEHLRKRGLSLTHPKPDPYARDLIRMARTAGAHWQIDRLLISALIEARSHERLSLLSGGLTDPELADFYASLARAERGHAQLFVDLCRDLAPEEDVTQRLEELSRAESELVARLPVEARIH